MSYIVNIRIKMTDKIRTIYVMTFIMGFVMLLGFSAHSSSQTVPSTLKYNLGSTTAWVPFGYSGNNNKPGILIEFIELIMKQAAIPTEKNFYL